MLFLLLLLLLLLLRLSPNFSQGEVQRLLLRQAMSHICTSHVLCPNIRLSHRQQQSRSLPQ